MKCKFAAARALSPLHTVIAPSNRTQRLIGLCYGDAGSAFGANMRAFVYALAHATEVGRPLLVEPGWFFLTHAQVPCVFHVRCFCWRCLPSVCHIIAVSSASLPSLVCACSDVNAG